MNREILQQLQWVWLYEEHRDAEFVCRCCGISRPTLRKWWNRYQDAGVAGLESRSRRPHNSPAIKVGTREERLILEIRRKRNLREHRIQSELLRQNNIALSPATIHKVLKKHNVKPVKKYRRKKDFVRYERPIPGDRVQMDTCKIGPGLIQFTAVDDAPGIESCVSSVDVQQETRLIFWRFRNSCG